LAPEKGQGYVVKGKLTANSSTELVMIPKLAVLPQHPATTAPMISENLALAFPPLTIPLLSRFGDHFHMGSNRQKLDSLQVFGPWIKNLASFWDPLSSLLDNGSTLRPAILNLVELDFREAGVSASNCWSI
jgi:hypothetical protein